MKVLFFLMGLGAFATLGKAQGQPSQPPILTPTAVPESFLPVFDSKTAREKLEWIWERSLQSRNQNVPDLQKANGFLLLKQSLRSTLRIFGDSLLDIKMSFQSDFAPDGYEKAIHAHGLLGKVRYRAVPPPIGEKSPSGLLSDSEVPGLLRLSFTSAPDGQTGLLAPGLALKLFRNRHLSSNISAIYSLDGQKEVNFFTHELSNVVPMGVSTSAKISSLLFRSVSKHPRKISVKKFAEMDIDGRYFAGNDLIYPYQIYFVPTPNLLQETQKCAWSTPSNALADLRNCLQKIWEMNPTQTLYDVFGSFPSSSLPQEQVVPSEREEMDTSPATYRAKARKLGEIIMESPFESSYFGDSLLFFKHDGF